MDAIDPQVFHAGDVVSVKPVNRMRSHFPSAPRGIVVGSYWDQYHNGGFDHYTVFLEGRGHVSWYYDEDLTLIEHGRIDMLAEWEAKARQERLNRALERDGNGA